MNTAYMPRAAIIDCTDAGIDLGNARYGGGLLIRDHATRDPLAAVLPDPKNHGLFDHAELVRRALAGDIGKLEAQLVQARALLAEAGGLIDDAVSSHIYDDHEEQPDDCAYKVLTDQIDRFLASQSGPANTRVVIYVHGGIVEEITTDTGAPGVQVVVIDADADGADDFYEYDGRNVAVSVHEPDLKPVNWARDFTDEDGEPQNPLDTETIGGGLTLDMGNFILAGGVIAPAMPEELHEAFHGGRAQIEGWGIFESDSRGLEINRDDESGRFETDDDAEAFVRKMAETSVYHAYALAIHDRVRQHHRDVARALGYEVVADPTGGTGMKWFATLRGEAVHGACRDEASAWTWAYMDAGEKGLLDDEG